MNVKKLIEFFSSIKEEKELTLTVEGAVSEMRKTGNPFHCDGRVVTKRTNMIVRINESYEEAVNDMRQEEGVKGKFKAKPLSWGTRVGDTCLIEHKGTHYLQCRVMSADPSVFFLDRQMMLLRDIAILKKFLPEKKEDTGRQKTDEEVVIRTIKLEGILVIEIDGKNIQVR